MKVAFTREKVYVPDFNGNKTLPENEQLRYKLKPMTVFTMTETLESIRATTQGISVEPGSPVKLEDLKIDADEQKRFVETCQKCVLEHVESIGAPLTFEDGEEVTMEFVVAYPQFLGLVTELFWQVVQMAVPSEEDVKN